jgi:hypothetical protein
MQKYIRYTLFIFTLAIFANCSKTKTLNSRLEGTWTIKSLEGHLVDSSKSIAVFQENAGQFVFGTKFGTAQGGKYEISIDVPSLYLTQIYTWTNDASTVTTDDNNASDRQVYKWDVLTNEKKLQVWSGNIKVGDKGDRLVIDKLTLTK